MYSRLTKALSSPICNVPFAFRLLPFDFRFFVSLRTAFEIKIGELEGR